MILLLNYLIAILAFVVIYLFEKLILLWIKKKPLLPFVNWALLVDAIAYTSLSFLLIGVIHIVFKKVDAISLIWLDIATYFLVKIAKPSNIFFGLKNKENISFNKQHALGISFFVIMLLECFAFNYQAYSDNKEVSQYTNFVCEDIASDGNIEANQITL